MKFLSGKAAILMLAFGVLAIAPATAHAATTGSGPTQCSASFTATTATSQCLGGTGEHRIACIYNHHIPGVGPIISHGPWQPVGSPSGTFCPPPRSWAPRSKPADLQPPKGPPPPPEGGGPQLA